MHIRHAFTLIELLVVLAILALLAAILFPVFAATREQARSIQCLSNCRQLGMAVALYTSDHDDTFPCSCSASMQMQDAGSTQRWTDTVQPYVRSREVFRCPDDASPGWRDAMQPRGSSYGLNGYLIPIEPPYYGVRLADLVRPAECVLLAELAEGAANDFIQPMYWGDPPRVTNADEQMMEWDDQQAVPRTLAFRRHREGANYSFADGHARWMRFPQTWAQSPGSPPSTDLYDPHRNQ
ncbi:MAG: DUF1559 domain-containing protein [Chthonomonadales bacterium]